MDFAKWGMGLGLGMMGLGGYKSLGAKKIPRDDPGRRMEEDVSGSLIVFGAAIVFLSSCADKYAR